MAETEVLQCEGELQFLQQRINELDKQLAGVRVS